MKVPVAAFGLAAALLLAGCGGGGQPAGPAGGQPGATDVNPQPRDAVRDGGDLRLPLSIMPSNYNYNQADGTTAYTLAIVKATMPSLFPGTPDGGFATNPDYLSSAAVTSTNPQVVTYAINPKATWSDGTPITWRDFEASWKAQNGTNPAFQTSGTVGYEDVASVVRGTDDKQVVVTFAKTFAEWQALFEPLYPASLYTDPAAFNTGWTTGMPVTAGPFTVEAIDQTAKTVTLRRDPRWWGTPAKLDRLVFRVLDDAAVPDALANNEIDFYDVGSSVDRLRRAQAIPGVAIRTSPSQYYNQLTFNGAPDAILADNRLRTAVAQGIDRQAIAQRMIGQISPDPKLAGNHIYRYGMKNYRDNSAVLPFDPGAAERALDNLGWARSGPGAPRARDGRPLTLRLVYLDVQSNTDLGKTVQNQLARIGVTVDLRPLPQNAWITDINKGNFDLAGFSWGSTPTPLSSGVGIFTSPLGDNVRQNYGRIASPEIDALFAQGIGELDDAKRADIGNRIDQLLWQNLHDLPLYPRPEVTAVRSTLANFGASGFADTDYINAGFVK